MQYICAAVRVPGESPALSPFGGIVSVSKPQGPAAFVCKHSYYKKELSSHLL